MRPTEFCPISSQPADFTDTSGSFTWTPIVPYFDIPITNDGIVEFNEDIWIELYAFVQRHDGSGHQCDR